MIWHAWVVAAMWWASATSGYLARPVPLPAPKKAAAVPRDHWAYQAAADLAAAGWTIPGAAAAKGGSLTRESFTTMTAQLVTAAAEREQAAKAIPMPQRILIARLVAEFHPTGQAAKDAARVPGLHPDTILSPDGSRLATFVPTPTGAEIVVVEKATLKTVHLPDEGYNYGPAWSADGDEVAWLSYSEGRTEVWVQSMLTGDEHLIGSALTDGWGKLTAVHDAFTLSLPGQPDRLVRIPAHLEPENNGAGTETPAPDKGK